MSRGSSRSRALKRARSLGSSWERRKVSPHLTSRFQPAPTDQDDLWRSRLDRNRYEIIPWLDATRTLEHQRILEVGIGTGASGFSLLEQGVDLVGIDVEPNVVASTKTMLSNAGFSPELHVLNATELAAKAHDRDQIIFWAALEHMTVAERLAGLAAAWSSLKPGGLLTVIETPNRLWPYDSHTSELPYFSWLPPELAYRYSHKSELPNFGQSYLESEPDEERMQHFLRRGTGVSFHDFAIAFEMDHEDIQVASCLQLARRDQAAYRKVGWALTLPGRTERTIRAYQPSTHKGWFQPFLYLCFRKNEGPSSTSPARS